MKKKILYFDCETTGTDARRHGIIQIAAIAEIDGEVVGYFDRKVRPFPDDEIEPTALEVNNINMGEIKSYPDPHFIYKEFINFLSCYIDRYDRSDKFQMVAYNGRFDDDFLRAWFDKLNNRYYGSWFSFPTIDPTNLLATLMIGRRHKLENFKLATVAQYLGVDVKDESLHDSVYDVQLLRQVFLKISSVLDPSRNPNISCIVREAVNAA
jgi:DNA polymerase-3 subunit epsilon